MENNLRTLKEAVKKGSISAAMTLAEGFKWGYFGGSDPRRAAAMYRICTRSKNEKVVSDAFYNLGLLYYHGFLLEDEEEKARKLAFACFMKSALKSPHKGALRLLGDMYRYGQYVDKNEEIALNLYIKASQGA
ncbi:MAG: sel1 repeat family protein [Clostridia bacterium]|nr:sel1 repeat family protein [Clostridia bacterium]